MIFAKPRLVKKFWETDRHALFAHGHLVQTFNYKVMWTEYNTQHKPQESRGANRSGED